MNRRNFFTALAKGVAAVTILPAATTYARSRWKVSYIGGPNGFPFDPTQLAGKWKVNPAWKDAEYECVSFAFLPVDPNRMVAILHRKDPNPFPDSIPFGPDPYPIRYQKDPTTGLLSRVEPLLEFRIRKL